MIHLIPHPISNSGQIHFGLPSDKWNEFRAALMSPPKLKANLKKLLTKPSVFDKAKETCKP